jgi:hypothetical protein
MRAWLLLLLFSFALPAFAGGPAGAKEIRGKLIQPESGPVSLQTGGSKVEIEADKDSNSVLHDRRLGAYEVALHGHFTDATHFHLDPFFLKPILAVKDGKEIHVSYWCSTCSIRSYTPGKCWCCQGETDLDLHGDDGNKAQ